MATTKRAKATGAGGKVFRQDYASLSLDIQLQLFFPTAHKTCLCGFLPKIAGRLNNRQAFSV